MEKNVVNRISHVFSQILTPDLTDSLFLHWLTIALQNHDLPLFSIHSEVALVQVQWRVLGPWSTLVPSFPLVGEKTIAQSRDNSSGFHGLKTLSLYIGILLLYLLSFCTLATKC